MKDQCCLNAAIGQKNTITELRQTMSGSGHHAIPLNLEGQSITNYSRNIREIRLWIPHSVMGQDDRVEDIPEPRSVSIIE